MSALWPQLGVVAHYECERDFKTSLMGLSSMQSQQKRELSSLCRLIQCGCDRWFLTEEPLSFHFFQCFCHKVVHWAGECFFTILSHLLDKQCTEIGREETDIRVA